MGFIFIAADWFGRTVVLSGEASRPASVTGPFDRESLNSVEQTFTVMVVSFMVAHAKVAKARSMRQLVLSECFLCASATLR
jgi:hypothetical protein